METTAETTRNGEPYARARIGDAWDVIVVGSGMGGLAAASLLARRGGKRVLLLERHYTLGGYTHVFRRPGYEWDVGVHYIGEVQPDSMVRRLFDAVGDGTLEWEPMGDVVEHIVLGDDVYEFPRGEANLRATLKARFPDEAGAIDAYFRLVHRASAAMQSFYMEKALPGPLAAVAGGLLRWRFLRLAGRTTRDVLESLTRDQRLVSVLTSQFPDYGLPPAESSFGIHAIVARHYFEGGYYPVGGASRIAGSVLPVLAAHGCRALVNAEVAEIVVENGRAVGVRMARDGRVLRAPIVVSDAGVANTFGRLVPEAAAARAGLPARLETVRPSAGHACLYVGFRHTARDLGLPRANLWVYPDGRHEENLARSLRDPEAPLPFVYASFPSAKDPDFERRHPGRATIDLLTVVPWERWARWSEMPWKKRGAEYEAEKERLARRMLEVLYAQMPRLRGKVDVYELSTPVTTRHFANWARGELYGLEHTPARFRQRFLRPRTPIAGLYLSGQDVSTCGVTGALVGGALCASAILGRNLVASPGVPRRSDQRAEPPVAAPPAAREVADSAA